MYGTPGYGSTLHVVHHVDDFVCQTEARRELRLPGVSLILTHKTIALLIGQSTSGIAYKNDLIFPIELCYLY